MRIISFLLFTFGLSIHFLNAQSVQWLTQEEGVKQQTGTDKILLFNVYADWCGFCKRMDEITFQEDGIVKTIHEHFIPVKFNAESLDDVNFNGSDYRFVNEGRRGHHAFASLLLNNRLSYPTLVYMNAEGKVLHRSPGYKDADVLKKEFEFILGGHYKTTTWKQYNASN